VGEQGLTNKIDRTKHTRETDNLPLLLCDLWVLCSCHTCLGYTQVLDLDCGCRWGSNGDRHFDVLWMATALGLW
jgi:hypothetical protein